ncbi:MAG: pyridoxamine 5'-phosphate oxidase family protein [Nitrospirae bacterium]|nr:pyridoxamine 5'-phosphate oxidase family protein [Nitrospirota bacterium]
MKKGSADVRSRLALFDKKQPHAVLATQSGKGPYVSLIAFGITPDGDGVIFATPRNSQKFRNSSKNGRVALMIDNRKNSAGDYMRTEAITITGRARPLRKGREHGVMSEILSRKHPRLKGFIGSASTSLIVVDIERVIHVANFQTVSEWPAV